MGLTFNTVSREICKREKSESREVGTVEFLSRTPLRKKPVQYEITATGCHVVINRSMGAYGYCRVSFEGKERALHRLIYEHAHGPVPMNLDVCHHCDNPGCINIDHLFAGTRQDNMDDMKNKQRACWGESHSCSRLTLEQVLFIKSSKGKIKQQELAERFSVTQGAISMIQSGMRWSYASAKETSK